MNFFTLFNKQIEKCLRKYQIYNFLQDARGKEQGKEYNYHTDNTVFIGLFLKASPRHKARAYHGKTVV